MKKFFGLFFIGLFISPVAFAATGSGEAQARLATPLSVLNYRNIRFGTVAIDASAGAQTVTMNNDQSLNCPAAYVCAGTIRSGQLSVYLPSSSQMGSSTRFYLSLEGSIATLSDGAGNTLTFDPIFHNGTDTYTDLGQTQRIIDVYGALYFTGTEPSGIYNTTNAGGSGYTVTVNY